MIFTSAKAFAPVFTAAFDLLPAPAKLSTTHGILGDDTLFITVCFTPKSEWANGIFHNSNYFQLMLDSDGTIEGTVSSLYQKGTSASFATRLPVKKFRKTKAKTMEAAVSKIIAHIELINKYYQ